AGGPDRALLLLPRRSALVVRSCDPHTLTTNDAHAINKSVRQHPCGRYGAAIQLMVPIVYSIPEGLESALHKFKDWGVSYRWLALPLGSIVSEFLAHHLGCIERVVGGIDTAGLTPTGGKRDFVPLETMINAVTEWPLEWDFGLLETARDGRPARGSLDPSFYSLGAGRHVTNQAILLVDDTWTTGATIASAAQRLHLAGARSVVALTIGRQLGAGWGNSDDLIESSRNRPFPADGCVLCG
ncbi:MAG: hypothetical protein ACRD29_11440, partial [Acidimicrobiales bacterium]